MLTIRRAQLAVFERHAILRFQNDLTRRAQAELALSKPDAPPERATEIAGWVFANARDFGLGGRAEMERLVTAIGRYFGNFGGRPPLSKPALKILYRRDGNAEAKLTALERLGIEMTTPLRRAHIAR